MQKAVLLFYKYQELPSPSDVRESQEALCVRLGLKGRIRVAEEGINGTLCGTQSSLDKYVASCAKTFVGVDWKFSASDIDAFDELKVRLADSLVSRSSKVRYDADLCGTHLTAEEFHSKAQEQDAVLIDVRNSYEYAIGRFQGAVNPDTRNFSHFSDWLKAQESKLLFEKSKFLLYCTGGIRCETASIELRQIAPSGADIYMLSGGIHRYLERYGASGLFKGKNFVFDKRITQKVDPIHIAIPGVAQRETSIVGKCTQCGNPFDQINSKRRCRKCRVLILICDECESTLCGVYYCDEHRHLDPRAVQENTQLLRDREKTLCGNLRSNCLKGRKCKTKRQALKKQLYEIRTLLAGEHDEGNSSAQHTSKGRSTCDE